MSETPPGEPDTVDDDLADDAAELILEANEQYQETRKEQHEVLKKAAEEDGAPLLETQCELYGHVVPVSGRLTGSFVERIEALDAEAKRRANGDSDKTGVSDIIRELAEILDDLIDDPELDAGEIYQLYRNEGASPVRTIVEEVMGSLKDEDERVRGVADGFRKTQ